MQRFKAILCIEEQATGDGRILAAGSMTWAPCPLPMDWQRTNIGGHDGAETVMVLERIWRDGLTIWGDGRVVGDWLNQDLKDLIDAGVVGPSIDPDDVVMELDDTDPERPLARFTSGRIRGATLVSHPAIVGTMITLYDDEVPASGPGLADDLAVAADPQVEDEVEGPNEDQPSRFSGAMIALVPTAAHANRYAVPGGTAPEDMHLTMAFLGQSDQLSTEFKTNLLASVAQIAAQEPVDGELWGTAHFNPHGDSPCAVYLAKADQLSDLHDACVQAAATHGPIPDQHSPFVPHMTAGYGMTPDQLQPPGPVTFDRIRVAYGSDEIHDFTLAAPYSVQALVASGAPSAPPLAWFDNPTFGQTGDDDPRLAYDPLYEAWGCPLTITDDGRVFGHVALWNTCHTGTGTDACTTPPASATDYAYFHTGEVLTAEGEPVPTGRITAAGGHASPGKGYRAAMAHYDNAGATAADIRVGEDQHGIWFAGALRPETTEAALRTLRGNPPSGDWRRIRGSLELMSVLCVNLPGFPLPRTATSGGRQLSLVAAGIPHLGPGEPLDPAVERDVVAEVLATIDRRALATGLAESVGLDYATKAHALALDVRSL